MLPKTVDLTNRKRLAVYACANREVLAEFVSPRRHKLPSKVKLRNNQTDMWINNNAICSA